MMFKGLEAVTENLVSQGVTDAIRIRAPFEMFAYTITQYIQLHQNIEN